MLIQCTGLEMGTHQMRTSTTFARDEQRPIVRRRLPASERVIRQEATGHVANAKQRSRTYGRLVSHREL